MTPRQQFKSFASLVRRYMQDARGCGFEPSIENARAAGERSGMSRLLSDQLWKSCLNPQLVPHQRLYDFHDNLTGVLEANAHPQ